MSWKQSIPRSEVQVCWHGEGVKTERNLHTEFVTEFFKVKE